MSVARRKRPSWRTAGSHPDRRRKRARHPGLPLRRRPPSSSIWLRRFPERPSSTRPRCFMPRRSVSSDPSRSAAPANKRAIRHQVSGVWISRDRSAAFTSAQQLRRQLRFTSTCIRGVVIWASERMASTVFRKAASRPVSSGRQKQLDLAAVAQAGSNQDALGQLPGSSIENGGRAAFPRVECRSRRSPAPTVRGRAGTAARQDGSVRPRRRIRPCRIPAVAATAAGAPTPGPGLDRAARCQGSAPAGRHPQGQPRPHRARPAASGVRSCPLLSDTSAARR